MFYASRGIVSQFQNYPLARVKRLLCALAAMFAGGNAWGQDRLPENLPVVPPVVVQSNAWTLAELQGWAEQHSPELPRAAAEVEVQRGRAWQAGLYRNPEVQGGSPQLGSRDSQYYAMLSQEIVTGRKLQLDRAAICKEVTQAELQFLRTRFDLLTQVRQSYYTTLTAQQRHAALATLVKIVSRTHDAARSLEKGGEGARGDTLLVELELERAEIGLENAAISLQAARRQLAVTLGDPDLIIERIEGDLAAALPDYPYDLSRAGLLTRNSLVQAAEEEIERQRILLRRAQVEPIPNVTIGGGYMYQVQDPNNMAMVNISLPIPFWNKNQGAVHAAQSNIGKATHAARKIQLDLTKQLAAATSQFDIARQRVSKYEKSILPKARESVKIAQQGFDQGQFDLMRALQSQRALIESELDYLTAQENRWLAAAEIAGLLQEEEFPEAGSREVPGKE
jgi:outer membrane protein, heavy metal efflux system